MQEKEKRSKPAPVIGDDGYVVKLKESRAERRARERKEKKSNK